MIQKEQIELDLLAAQEKMNGMKKAVREIEKEMEAVEELIGDVRLEILKEEIRKASWKGGRGEWEK